MIIIIIYYQVSILTFVLLFIFLFIHLLIPSFFFIESGFEAVDAPVSGGVPRANDGTLTFMVGGEDDVEPRYHFIFCFLFFCFLFFVFCFLFFVFCFFIFCFLFPNMNNFLGPERFWSAWELTSCTVVPTLLDRFIPSFSSSSSLLPFPPPPYNNNS